MTNKLLLVPLTSLIISCGGSGGSDSSNNNAVVPDSADIIVIGDEITTGQAVDLFLYAPQQSISDITWRQTAGTEVNLLSPKSKAIAFTPSIAGSYSFEVTYLANGQQQSLMQSIDVSAGTTSISARLGHAVVEGNNVSLRAQIAETLDIDSVSWQQISGPTVSYSGPTSGELAIFFDAPQVNQDTILEFEVSAQGIDATHQDKVAVIVEDKPEIANNAYFEEPIATVFPYNSDTPYASTLVSCVYSNILSSSCRLAQLPLIANDTTTPSIDDIMDRVVVSHTWMGDRFKEFLENFDPNNDFKNLLRATTAIVISYDVRPSFYWAATGAIYLDAENFWQTAHERDTINEAPDFRASFGNELQFVMPWRYVKDNNYASFSIPRSLRTDRSPTDGLFRLSSLMYHELAHANDFFPSSEWFIHDSNTRILDAAQNTNFESDKLDIIYPLNSQIMKQLANVSFKGADATATQQNYLPSDIRQFFSNDIANDYYNYSSTREDLAMLFEELMMHSRYGVERDVAITNRPTGDNITARDYIVTWGQRGRIGQLNIKPRVSFVSQRILPEFNATQIINALPTPIAMEEDKDWIENLNISPLPQANSINKTNTLRSKTKSIVDDNKPEVTRYYHKKLPKH